MISCWITSHKMTWWPDFASASPQLISLYMCHHWELWETSYPPMILKLLKGVYGTGLLNALYHFYTRVIQTWLKRHCGVSPTSQQARSLKLKPLWWAMHSREFSLWLTQETSTSEKNHFSLLSMLWLEVTLNFAVLFTIKPEQIFFQDFWKLSISKIPAFNSARSTVLRISLSWMTGWAPQTPMIPCCFDLSSLRAQKFYRS